jgi:HlyD family secretion protein
MKLAILKPGLPLVALVAFAFAAFLVWSAVPERVTTEPLETPPINPYRSSVAAVGLVEPASENVAIGTPVSGLVTTVHVQPGEQVAAGQPLFSLDDREFQAMLRVRQQELAAALSELERLAQLPRPESIPPVVARVDQAEQRLADARVQLEIIESIEDPRAIRHEDLLRRRIAVRAAEAELAAASAELALLEAGAWRADLDVAAARVALPEEEIGRIRTDIERLTVTAPAAGHVLKLDVRTGEYAQAGVLRDPLLVFGDVAALHVRADIDEREAHLVDASAPAYANPRGDAGRKIPLEFVRFEPYVVPKRQLTGDVVERVDTRVLQVIYRLLPEATSDHERLFVGQQVDVFIERRLERAASGEPLPSVERRAVRVSQ